MNQITLSFAELGISRADFNGYKCSAARAEVINRACDHVMHYFFMGYNEHECIFYPEDAEVGMLTGRVTLDVAEYSTH